MLRDRLNIMDLEVKSLFMSALLLLGVAESGQLSLLGHISSTLGLHQEAVFMKLPHSLEPSQLLGSAPALCASWPLPGALRAADLPPAQFLTRPTPSTLPSRFVSLVFLGAVFSEVWFKSLHE